MMMTSSRLSADAARTRRNRLVSFLFLLILLTVVGVWRESLSGFFWQRLLPILSVRFVGEKPLSSVPIESVAAALADREALYRENIDLKARLGREMQAQRILGGVISRPPATPYDTLVIDAGVLEGVSTGDLVSAGGTIIVGTVSEVYPHVARVTLYSSPGETYDALLHLSGGVHVPVAIEGQGGGSLRAQVPAGTAVEVGDSALLPGIAGGVSALVSSIEKAEGESFSTLYFSLPVNPSTLRFVEVWKHATHDQN